MQSLHMWAKVSVQRSILEPANLITAERREHDPYHTLNQEASSSADLQEHGDEQDRQGEAEDTLRGREDPEASCLASEPRIPLGSPP